MEDPILKRRAIRKFTDEEISQADLDALIAAFQASPCGMHQTDKQQAVLVTSPDWLEKVEAATDNSCYGAKAIFIIGANDEAFGPRNSSVAVENILVEAARLGLGGVYIMGGAMKLASQTELVKDLGFDPGFKVAAMAAIGHPAEAGSDEDRSSRYKLIIK